jgi:hypothetical protein
MFVCNPARRECNRGATREAHSKPCPNEIADEPLHRSLFLSVAIRTSSVKSPISSLFRILIRFRVWGPLNIYL